MTGQELDREIWQQLRTLTKDNAAGVAKHLVMAGLHLDDDLEAARAHAETAVRRAGRVPAAREALGLVFYRQGEWAKALAEFRTVRRMVESPHLLPLIVDSERALGRLERALELAGTEDAGRLEPADRAELAMVVAGVRRDLGQHDAAVVELRGLAARTPASAPWAARVYYALADAFTAVGDGQARLWFSRAADADVDGQTDAAERLDEFDGVQFTDLLEDSDESTEDPANCSAESSEPRAVVEAPRAANDPPQVHGLGVRHPE